MVCPRSSLISASFLLLLLVGCASSPGPVLDDAGPLGESDGSTDSGAVDRPDGAPSDARVGDRAETLADDASTTDARSTDAGSTCGAMTCSTTEICIHPACSAGTLCDPPDDAGACPPGWSYQPVCFRPAGPQAPGCAPPPCTPPPSYCVPRPASCSDGGISCTCLPFNVCNGPDGGGVNGGQCAFVGQRDVTCAFQFAL